MDPSGLNRPQLYARSVPPLSTLLNLSVSRSYTYTLGFVPFSPNTKCSLSGCTHTNPTPPPSMPCRYVCSNVSRFSVCTIAPTVKITVESSR